MLLQGQDIWRKKLVITLNEEVVQKKSTVVESSYKRIIRK